MPLAVRCSSSDASVGLPPQNPRWRQESRAKRETRRAPSTTRTTKTRKTTWVEMTAAGRQWQSSGVSRWSISFCGCGCGCGWFLFASVVNCLLRATGLPNAGWLEPERPIYRYLPSQVRLLPPKVHRNRTRKKKKKHRALLGRLLGPFDWAFPPAVGCRLG